MESKTIVLIPVLKTIIKGTGTEIILVPVLKTETTLT